MTGPAAGEAQVTHQFRTAGGQRIYNVVYGVDNPDAHDATYIAQNARVDLIESLMGVMTDSTQLIGTRAVTGEGSFFLDPVSDFGDIADGAASPAVAYLLHKGTGLIGRHNQGRMYLPGVGESKINAVGAVDAAFRATITTAANTFLAKLAADAIPMVILQGPGGSVEPPVVTDLSCDAQAATQRRRQRS